jgi:hemolysin activation/secretion protein
LETRKRRVDLGLAVEHIEHESSMLRHRLFQDRITVLHQNATFGMGSLMDRTRHQLQITQSHGVPLTSSRPAALRSRAIGSHHFHSVTGQWQTDHQLGKRGYILSRTLGKWSDRPLLSSQMMGFGGWQMGRGMPSSAVSGDRILMTHLEAGYRFRTPWGLGWSPSVFYDTAYRWTWPAEYPTPLRQGATTGVALATQLPYNVNLSLSLGVPVIKHHDKNLFEWRGTKTYLYVGVRW